MKKKGFTLVELLAVIIVLAVIILVALPKIATRLQRGKDNAFLVLSKNVIRQLTYNDFSSGMSTLADMDLGNMNVAGINLNESIAYVADDSIYLNLVGSSEYSGMNLCGVNLSTKEAEVQSTACPAPTLYTVTFNPNGGVLTKTTKQVLAGGTYGDLPVPVRTGYRFMGWNGKNKLNLNDREVSQPGGAYGNTSVRNLLDGKGLYNGLTANNYYSNGMIQEYNIDRINNNVTIKATSSSGYGLGFDIVVTPNTTYTISKGTNSQLSFRLGYYKEDGTFISFNSNASQKYTFTTPANTKYLTLVVGTDSASQANTTLTNYNIQIESGSTNTTFEPFYIRNDTKVVQNTNHTLTAVWEPI